MTGPTCFWRLAASRRSACAALLVLAWWAGPETPRAQAAEYRDPGGRFSIALTDGLVEVDGAVLETRLGVLRRGGATVPAYQAAFDRGVEPRLTYPYALLEVVPVPGASWTTADLESLLGRMNTQGAAREAAATFDRLGLGNLLRDPRITFLRWEPERQAGAYRIRTQAQGTEVAGEGRIYFYRGGYISLWLYYLAGTPYPEVADRFTAALTVLPDHRVPPPARVTPWGTILIVGAGALIVVGSSVWLAMRRRRGGASRNDLPSRG